MLQGNHNRQLPHTPPFLTNGNDTILDNGNLIIKKVASSSFEQTLHVLTKHGQKCALCSPYKNSKYAQL